MKLTELVPNPSGPVDITIDEGGMRCSWKSSAAYIPLTAIQDVSVDETFFGGVRLVIDGHYDDDVLKLEVSKTASPVSIQRVLLVGLAEQRRCAPVPLPGTMATRIARRERPLDEWLLDLLTREMDAGYRETPLDRSALEKVLDDPHGLVESRAAAAWVLLNTADENHLRAAVRSVVDHAVPPLVIAVARIPTAHVLVPHEVYQAATAFLSSADRSALSRLEEAQVKPEAAQIERLETALAQAKEAVMARIKKEMDDLAEAHEESKWRRLHNASSGSDTRWVGKTWAL